MILATIDFNEALPPLDAVMPATSQTVIFFAFALTGIGFLLYAIYLAKRWNNWLPVMFWVGSLLAVSLEPVADMALHAIHPPVGQWNAFTSHGFPIPWHIVFAYSFYYSAMLILFWPMIARRTLTRRLAWTIFVIGAVWVTLIEQIPISKGIWLYYGPQAFRIGVMPISMIVPNAASVSMVTYIIYKLAPSINTGWKRFIAIPAVPITALATHAGSSGFMYDVMGMDLQKLGLVFLNMMAVISAVMGVVAVWITIELTQDKSDTTQPIATRL
jgi:hypothetical protein